MRRRLIRGLRALAGWLEPPPDYAAIEAARRAFDREVQSAYEHEMAILQKQIAPLAAHVAALVDPELSPEVLHALDWAFAFKNVRLGRS